MTILNTSGLPTRKRYKIAREVAGLSQSELAEIIGVSRTTVGEWESGRTETLFELDVEWAPLYKPFGLTLLSLILPDRCRDCGVIGQNREHYCQGSREAGLFQLCDVCAALDDHWGIRVIDREELKAIQNNRRDAYRRQSANLENRSQ